MVPLINPEKNIEIHRSKIKKKINLLVAGRSVPDYSLSHSSPNGTLVVYNINLSKWLGIKWKGPMYLGKGAPRIGYRDPSGHKTRNIWQVSNH